jgi:Glycosyltransferase family 87
VLTHAGVQSTVGGGYSYPMVMAELARPLALLPPQPAGALFTIGSLLCLALAVALLLSPLTGAPRWQLLLLATAAGLFGPINGSIWFGQVNTYLLPVLVLAFRGIQRPGMLALAAAVKLYPVGILAAFAANGLREWRTLLAAAAGTGALVVAPNLMPGHSSYGLRLVGMLGPDPYWTNQSINGWLSRLALPSDVTRPPLPGLPVTPVMLLICAGLGLLALAVLLRRPVSWAGAFSLLLCLSVVAAPKNSLWNFAPLIVALVYGWSVALDRPRALALLALSWALIDGQRVVEHLTAGPSGHPAAAAWLSSVPLYGAFLLCGVLIHLLLQRRARGMLDETAPARAAA